MYQETFHVQCSFLYSLSPVFKAMLSLPLVEARKRIININDVDPRYILTHQLSMNMNNCIFQVI